jgi:hypothetical protein
MSKVGGATGQSSPAVRETQSSQPSGQVQKSKVEEKSTIPSDNPHAQKASKQEATSRFSDYQLEGQTRQAELNSKLSAENAVFKSGTTAAQTVLVSDSSGPEENTDTDGEDMPPPDYFDNSDWVYQEESVPETESLRVKLMVESQTTALNQMMIDALKAEKEKLAEKAEIVQNKIDRYEYRDAMKAAIEQYGIDVSDVKGIPKFDKELRRLEGKTSGNREVTIGRAAFSSAGYLASSIGHEAQHAKQVAEGRWYTGISSQGEAINEIESYDWELKNASKHGLTEQEINIIKGRRQEWMDELEPAYKQRVEEGDYTWP